MLSLLPFFLCSSHSRLPRGSLTRQLHASHKPFALATSSAWNGLPWSHTANSPPSCRFNLCFGASPQQPASTTQFRIATHSSAGLTLCVVLSLSYFTVSLLCSLSPSTRIKVPRGQDFCLFCLLLYSQNLAHNRCSAKNHCWMISWVKEWRNVSFTVVKHSKEISVFRINLRQGRCRALWILSLF